MNAVIGFCAGVLLMVAFFTWAGSQGERAERQARIRAASNRSRRALWGDRG